LNTASGDVSHLAALCGRVVERGELAENLCGLAVTQESLQQVEEIPILKIKDSQEKGENEHENVKYQCCGSTCFWASWIRIHESDVWIRIRILLSSFYHQAKIVGKTLIPKVL
jgi:hypothetical protein